MNKPYIIAEAAQGYEGSVEISKLLIRGAKMAGADAIKFQMVYADDLAEEGYQYYDLFRSLEMSLEDWQEIRHYAQAQKIDFIVDIFGQNSYQKALMLKAEGVKIHSTSFFDAPLIEEILTLEGEIYFSIGGIYPEEVLSLVQKYHLDQKRNVHILYGFQAEPTLLPSNNLLRILELKKYTGMESIGFMDHSDGAGVYTISLSAVALGLGVRIFEKHITLDRCLEMEDYTSALGVRDFATYVSSLRDLYQALGSSNLALTEEEKGYRNRAIKRVIAAKNLQSGHLVTLDDVRMNRPKVEGGCFKVEEVLGKKLQKEILAGEAFREEHI